MFKKLSQVFRSPDMRKKIFFTLGALLLFRLTTQVTLPGANLDAIRAIFAQNNLLGVFSALTGGSAHNFSIVLMGVSPYINASIIIQLLAVIIPKFESLSKEGPEGQRTLNKYTRWLAVPLALLQSYGTIALLNSQSQLPIVENIQNPMVIIPIMITATAGTMWLMWLGEIITEKGIGNGISLIIFANIVSGIPQIIAQGLFVGQVDSSAFIPFVGNILFTIIMLVMIVLMTEGERRIPITYAGQKMQLGANQSNLPIKINQAGMVPIIFAVSLINFPGLAGQLMQRAASARIRGIGEALISFFNPSSVTYLALYFIFIVLFTYFYVSITFNPKQIAENIQKRGGYIPGIRPGTQTVQYISKISTRLTLFGGLFLAFIALAPSLLNNYVFKAASSGSVANLISGAGMIIIVGVVLDLVRQVNAQLIMHDYDKLV